MTAPAIVEVALRDGLQNEKAPVSTEAKVRLGTALVAAGARRVEAVSFAHPRLVPSMADAEEVLAGLPRAPGVSYSGLVLNERGMRRALGTDVHEVNVVVCASDTFNRRNQGVSRDRSLAAAAELIPAARAAGRHTTLTVATAFGCPFEGEIDPAQVVRIVDVALAAGADEICLADTIGAGVPPAVLALCRAVRERHMPLRLHFHNTRNTGFANAWAAVGAGAAALDASVGGIGGCPFAPGATGNIGTEDLVYLLHRSGIPTGYDLDALLKVTAEVEVLLGRPTSALLPRAGAFPVAGAS